MKTHLKLLLLLLISAAFRPAWAQTPAYVIKNLVADFGAYGDGTHDDSQAFTDASTFFNTRHGYGKLVIPNGVYRVGIQVINSQKPSYVTDNYYLFGIYLFNFNSCSHLTIQGDSSSVIKYRDGLYYGTFETNGTPCTSNCDVDAQNHTTRAKVASIGSVFNIVDSDSITIKNLELDGNNPNFVIGGHFSDGYQIDHDGIFIDGSCYNIAVNNVNAHHFGRDGMQLAATTPNSVFSAPNNIVLNNSTFDYNGRQGLSWIGGNGLTATNCSFSHTGKGSIYSAPGAGIDFEAESGSVSGGNFYNCTFNLNKGAGIIADRQSASAPFVGTMVFNSSQFKGNDYYALFIRGNSGFGFYQSQVAGPLYYTNNSSSIWTSIRFIQTSFDDTYNGQEQMPGAYALLDMPLLSSGDGSYSYFDECSFTVHKKQLMYIPVYPYGTGCSSYSLSRFALFQRGHFFFDPNNAPSGLIIPTTAGVSFMGYCEFGPLSTSTSTTPAHSFYWREAVFQGESNAGISYLRATPTATTNSGRTKYSFTCPGLTVGASASDAQDLIVESGNDLVIESDGQLWLGKAARIIVKAGAGFYVSQSAQMFYNGKIIIESGATVSISPYATVYSGCDAELYVDPNATLGYTRTDFSATHVKVTGHSSFTSGTPCSQRPLAIGSGAEDAQAAAYPNPFQDELTISLPPTKAATTIQVFDTQGRLVYKHEYQANATPAQVTLGRGWATGLYSALVQSAGVKSVIRLEKN